MINFLHFHGIIVGSEIEHDYQRKSSVSPECFNKTGRASAEIKNNALKSIASALATQKEQIISANRMDLEIAKKESLSAPY